MSNRERIRTPVRILFQGLTTATALKAKALSASATTGGGARDLRLSPHSEVQPFMEQMFSGEKLVSRNSGVGGSEEVSVRFATATWGLGRPRVEVEYWPPTPSRPNEGRIGRISALRPLSEPPSIEEEPVVLFVQDSDDLIWVRYATVTGLRQSVSQVSDFICTCLERTRRGTIASGYIDLTDGRFDTWCSGMREGTAE